MLTLFSCCSLVKTSPHLGDSLQPPGHVMVSYLGNRGFRVHSTSSSCRKTSRSSSVFGHLGSSSQAANRLKPPTRKRRSSAVNWMAHNLAKDPVAEASGAVIDVFHGNVSGLVEHLSPGKTLTILGSGCFILGNPPTAAVQKRAKKSLKNPITF